MREINVLSPTSHILFSCSVSEGTSALVLQDLMTDFCPSF